MISAFLQDLPDAIIIAVIIIGSAALSTVEEYSSGNAAEKLRQRLTAKATVLRDGQPTTIPATAVVPGDIALLSAGSLIPADGILLEANDFFASEAVLTGESFPVEKRQGIVPQGASLAGRTNCVYMGTNARSGTARIAIAETGPRTAFGQIAGRLNLRPPETEFEHGIRRLGYLLSEVTLVLVFAVLVVNVRSTSRCWIPCSSRWPSRSASRRSCCLRSSTSTVTRLAGHGQSRGDRAPPVGHRELRQHGRPLHGQDRHPYGRRGEARSSNRPAGARLTECPPRGATSNSATTRPAWRTRWTTPSAPQLAWTFLRYKKIDEIPYDFIRKRLTVVVHQTEDEGHTAPDASSTVPGLATAAGGPTADDEPFDSGPRPSLFA